MWYDIDSRPRTDLSPKIWIGPVAPSGVPTPLRPGTLVEGRAQPHEVCTSWKLRLLLPRISHAGQWRALPDQPSGWQLRASGDQWGPGSSSRLAIDLWHRTLEGGQLPSGSLGAQRCDPPPRGALPRAYPAAPDARRPPQAGADCHHGTKKADAGSLRSPAAATIPLMSKPNEFSHSTMFPHPNAVTLMPVQHFGGAGSTGWWTARPRPSVAKRSICWWARAEDRASHRDARWSQCPCDIRWAHIVPTFSTRLQWHAKGLSATAVTGTGRRTRVVRWSRHAHGNAE